jgi:intron-binding protein aquarius
LLPLLVVVVVVVSFLLLVVPVVFDRLMATKLFQAPTVSDILGDSLTKLSVEYWGPDSSKRAAYSADIVEQLWTSDIVPSLQSRQVSRLILLELSHYLENYLWPNFDAASASLAHLLSIMVMVNEKRRENVEAAWGM